MSTSIILQWFISLSFSALSFPSSISGEELSRVYLGTEDFKFTIDAKPRCVLSANAEHKTLVSYFHGIVGIGQTFQGFNLQIFRICPIRDLTNDFIHFGGYRSCHLHTIQFHISAAQQVRTEQPGKAPFKL